jgi:hypothetical protein
MKLYFPQKKYVVWDTETTGLDHNNDEVIQLSAIRFNNGQKEKYDVFIKVAEYMWHPYAPHYGVDLELEEDGQYTIHANIQAPTFDRMHIVNGKRYEDEIDVKLGTLEVIIPGYQDEDGSESLRMERDSQ